MKKLSAALALAACAGGFGGPNGSGLKKLSAALALAACAGGFGGPSGSGLKKLSAALALAACAGGFGGPSGSGLKKLRAALALTACAGGFGGPSGAGLKKLNALPTEPAIASKDVPSAPQQRRRNSRQPAAGGRLIEQIDTGCSARGRESHLDWIAARRRRYEHPLRRCRRMSSGIGNDGRASYQQLRGIARVEGERIGPALQIDAGQPTCTVYARRSDNCCL